MLDRDQLRPTVAVEHGHVRGLLHDNALDEAAVQQLPYQARAITCFSYRIQDSVVGPVLTGSTGIRRTRLRSTPMPHHVFEDTALPRQEWHEQAI